MTIYDRTLARLSRRELMKLGWLLGAAAIAPPVLTRRVFAKPVFDAYPFSLGVASGDPLPDGIVLWTRLAPKPLEGGGMPMAIVEVDWEIARDARFQAIAQKGTTLARPELGHSVHVEVGGLEPAREYWYRFRAGDEISQVGRTQDRAARGRRGRSSAFCRLRLQPLRDRLLHRVSAHRRRAVRLRLPHRRLHLRRPRRRRHAAIASASTTARRSTRSSTIATATRSTSPIAICMAAHASAPWIVSWDDHEVDNNYAGDFDENGTPPEIFVLRRAAAYQAYYETMPLRASAHAVRQPHAAVSPPAVRQPHRSQRARHAAVAIRSGVRRRRRGPTAPDALDPARTMMGAEQEKWLFDNLATRESEVDRDRPAGAIRSRSIARRSIPHGRFSMDKWDGYVAARQRLYNRLLETKAPNPIVLSGDVHQHYGADLKLDFTDPRSATVGVEFTNTSMSTTGDGSDVSATWEATRGDNPHINYHSNRRGYIACTATPAQMRAEFKILDKVTVAGHAGSHRRSARRRGRPAGQQHRLEATEGTERTA